MKRTSRTSLTPDRYAPAPMKNGGLGRLGWREWVSLPGLGIPWIKAKLDTGARTSSLHAEEIELFRSRGRRMARFLVHPLQGHREVLLRCEAPVVDVRTVKDSGGHEESRPVVLTSLEISSVRWEAEVTLTSRDTMLFRMLLGRTGLRGRFLVDSGRSFLSGKPRPEQLRALRKGRRP